MTPVLPLARISPNDEPVYEDTLGHRPFVKQIGEQIRRCTPPYVVGVQGAWGSGKTSFLRKLWAYLGGTTDLPDGTLQGWFGSDFAPPDRVYPIWFNPWQHQFEASPMVALLQEIRCHFAATIKLFDEARKLTNVATYAGLSMLGELSTLLPKVDIKKIAERGQEYEADRFATPLSSQHFRELFEGAIQQVAKDGRLVVFIDDLDRCEGSVAYRFLESLKLYLNAKNCVYVLGLDQKHLESAIARELSNADASRHRPLAREYLGKMFQCQFLLPITQDVSRFVADVLRFEEDSDFAVILANRYSITADKRQELVTTLNECLPHNPRKIKSFLAAWRLYLLLLAEQKPNQNFDWKVTLLLNYLAQFEEPLYRKVEESPGFLQDEILKFCSGREPSYQFKAIFEGLELPYESIGTEAAAVVAGAADSESFNISPVAELISPPSGRDLATPSPAPGCFGSGTL